MMVLVSFCLYPTSETKSGDREQTKLKREGVPRVGHLSVTCTGVIKENWAVPKDDGAWWEDMGLDRCKILHSGLKMVKDETGPPYLGLARKLWIPDFSRSSKDQVKDPGKNKDQ